MINLLAKYHKNYQNNGIQIIWKKKLKNYYKLMKIILNKFKSKIIN